jgi:hypothetical protein
LRQRSAVGLAVAAAFLLAVAPLLPAEADGSKTGVTTSADGHAVGNGAAP